MKSSDVAILGGGPAGASLAIRLASAGFSVTVLERTHSQQHKLCGEFISPEVTDRFRELSVLDKIRTAGAVPITQLVLTTAMGSRFEVELPGTAFGFSRRALDQILIDRASEAGAFVRRGAQVVSVEGNSESGYTIRTDGAESFQARIVVGAFGKRSPLDRSFDRPHLKRKSPWVAFKSHFTGFDTGESIELHLFRRGYCGMSMVEGGDANVCWIMHSDELKRAGGRPETIVRDIVTANPELEGRFDGMSSTFPKFLSAAQLSFRPRGCFAKDVPLVGDAAGMISPLCGDGIAMAIESSRLLSPLLVDVLNGARSYEQFRNAYESLWAGTFRSRMRIGRQLQRILMAETPANVSVRVANAMPGLGRALIRATRGRVSESDHRISPWRPAQVDP